MRISKSSPEMKNIIKIDRLYHQFSLLEKLKSEKWIFPIDRSDDIHDWEYEWSDDYIYWWDASHSLTWWYLSAYKKLLPEVIPVSHDWAVYILKANAEEIRVMEERIYEGIPEIILSEQRLVTQEFLKKLSGKWRCFSGNILREGISSMSEFIPLLYENGSDIQMNFSYTDNWNDEYEVDVYLSYIFKESKQLPGITAYLIYDEDSRDIIFKGKRIDMTSAEVDLLRVFIDEKKPILDISTIAEIIAHRTTLTDKEKKYAKKQYIYNVRAGLNKKLASIFWNTESVYMVGRNGMLHFRFPEFIKEK